MIIIKFIAFLFLAFIVAGLLFLVLVGFGIKNMLRRFRQGNISDGGNNGQSSWQRGQGSWNQGQNNQDYTDDEVIIDQRSPEQANRKIYSENDGEYVDFTEE